MRGVRVPKIVRDPTDRTISLSHRPNHCSLIWLHGLGDSSEGFLSFFTHALSPLYRGVRIRLLQAPTIPVTINQFTEMPAWYDIRSPSRFKGQESYVFDMLQVQSSTKIVKKYVDEEVEYWLNRDKEQAKNNQSNNTTENAQASVINPYHRVFVGGFSQGGVIALRYALTAAHPPAGCMAVSSYLLKSTPLTNLRKLPCLLMHGNRDQVITEVEAKHSYQQLLKDENLVEYTVREGLGHTVELQQLQIMNKWFQDVNAFIKKHYQSYTSEQK